MSTDSVARARPFRFVHGTELIRAMIAAGITEVPHHACALCGYETCYRRRDEMLTFDAGCYCTDRRRELPRSWQDAADWINMQTDLAKARKLAARFGLTLEPPEAEDPNPLPSWDRNQTARRRFVRRFSNG